METEQFDSAAFDAPVTRKPRRYKTASQKAYTSYTHKVWAYAPHCGAEFVLPELTQKPLAEGATGVFCFAELSEWKSNGGHLMLNMGEINAQNNRSVCETIANCDRVTWVSETRLHRFKQICLIENVTGKSFKDLSAGDPVSINALGHLHEACLHANMWDHIMRHWHRIFGGARLCVSDIWADHWLPWPQQVVNNYDNHPSHNGAKASIAHMLREADGQQWHSFNTREVAQYFVKMPLYHYEK